MHKETMRPAWVEVNLKHLEYNITQIQNKVGSKTGIIGVVKADGYGHGAKEVANVLLKHNVMALAVATIKEAVTLRKSGFTCPIIVLSLTADMYVDILVQYDLIAVCGSYANAFAIHTAAKGQNKNISLLIAIDTGMGRIGLLPSAQGITEVQKISALSHVHLMGIMSHFATSDEADKTYALQQLSIYDRFCKGLKSLNIHISLRTIGNSAAIMELPSSYYEAVRSGIILYGCYPSGETDPTQLSLKPVMSVKANIVQLKTVPPGTYVSYGRRYQARRESLIGTIELGYADGYPRALSGCGRVIVRGCYAPVAGTICMDQCMIDVTDVPDVQDGDEVIIMGSDGTLAVTAEEIAEKTNTINYEVLCSFGQRLPKYYIR